MLSVPCAPGNKQASTKQKHIRIKQPLNRFPDNIELPPLHTSNAQSFFLKNSRYPTIAATNAGNPISAATVNR